MPTSCTTPPRIIGARPNRACIGTPVGGNVTEYVITKSYCSGKNITDFIFSTPVGMIKSPIINLGSDIRNICSIFVFRCSNLSCLDTYQLILIWIPTYDQFGSQSFCAGAVDNTYIQSEQWCITFLVGLES